MSNKDIALVFVILSWAMLLLVLLSGWLFYVFYAVICVLLSTKVYIDQGKAK